MPPQTRIALNRFQVEPFFADIQDELKRVQSLLIQQAEAFEPGIRGYIEYAVENQGQRIRPALCLLSARATGGIGEEHRTLALILELIHLASLIHDDIMDNALLRRARPTCHAKWGSEISVLLGDCLFVQATKLSSRLSCPQLTQKLADSAGDVCAGEILQTQRQFDLKLTVTEYLHTIELKTSALFRSACETSALLNQKSSSETDALRAYGKNLGIAYQIYDDLTDLFGGAEAGKTLGSDLAKGKFTLPLLHAIPQMKPSETDQLTEKLLKEESLSPDWVIEKIVQYGGHRFAVRKACDYLESARKNLDILSPSQEKETLQSIPASLRKHLCFSTNIK